MKFVKLNVKIIVNMAKKCHKCEEKCGKGKVHPGIVKDLDNRYQEFLKAGSQSLLQKYLTREVFDKLKTRKTNYGCSLLDCIKSGLENPDSGVGLYAADPDCYTVYEDLFDAVIKDYHGFRKSDVQPPKDWGDINKLGNIDPKGQYIVSTRVRCGRMLEGYPFGPQLTEEQYLEIESKLSDMFKELPGEIKGNYYPLNQMSKEEQQKLIDDHFLFKEGDRFLQSANNCRFWPNGRGIFYNENKTFLIWVNEEDHMRLISLQQGGNLKDVYKRLVTGADEIEKRVKIMRSDRLGYLTFCPTNLGTTIRASVHIKVPKLAKNIEKLNELANKLNLQVRGTAGEHSEAVGGVYDISNKRRLGITEGQIIQEMYLGILEIINQERQAK